MIRITPNTGNPQVLLSHLKTGQCFLSGQEKDSHRSRIYMVGSRTRQFNTAVGIDAAPKIEGKVVVVHLLSGAVGMWGGATYVTPVTLTATVTIDPAGGFVAEEIDDES